MPSSTATAPINPTATQCPKCGKLSIVAQPDNSYRCLSCDFHRDFSKDKKKEKKSGGLLAILVAVVTLLLLL
ncbi:MAG: hypothetical protein ACFB4J_01750 [Elainellaceae cyanobacterium]